MPPTEPPSNVRGRVVAYAAADQGYSSEHERVTRLEMARRIAELKGYDYAGTYDASSSGSAPLYFVPSATLVGRQALALGIQGCDDLFGGVVPQAFVATKSISHPLLHPAAAAPLGWNPDFTAQLGDAVLAGFTAFSFDDARAAGLRLLQDGPVRIKPVRATGGRGQLVARTGDELESGLASMDPQEIRDHGLVLEENLDEVTTFSVGQVSVGATTASYFGFQRLTANNAGEAVYGGSDLTVVRGDFEALMALEAADEIRHAVDQARRYDAGAKRCFPGLFASRNNYDIVRGRDAAGRWRSAVLEQSWRLGGASGAELAALEVFRDQPQRQCVIARTVEVFGESADPPAGATVYFRGIDPVVGPLTKYTEVLDHVDA